MLKGQMSNRIDQILKGYVAAESFTSTEAEREAEAYLMELLGEMEYFKENPHMFGTHQIEDDAYGRATTYALVKGSLGGGDTVVLIHHSDVVGIEDFKLLKPYAFSPDELEEALLKIEDSLQEEAREDLRSGDYMFGRGTADMKGGGAIQLALLERYSMNLEFKGNILMIAVPDEENLSAGMRSAVHLMVELKKRHGLEYKLMINSEPHQRKRKDVGIFSIGSVGKIMPFVYVRGFLAHIGKVYEGLNPLNLMGEIVRQTELNISMSDVVGDEMAPPPTWLYLRDSKSQYDVSMPLSAYGCFSILTLNQNPHQVLDGVKSICKEAFSKIIDEMNRGYSVFCKAKNIPLVKLPWQPIVVGVHQLIQEAEDGHGEKFAENFKEKLSLLVKSVREGELSIIQCNYQLMEFIFEYIDDISPRVVYGLLPPYYPNVSNHFMEGLEEKAAKLPEVLRKYTRKEFDQDYETELFYTGISDLSYTSIRDGRETTKALEEEMPLYGQLYNIPIEGMEEIAMPCINIGPWGKDFHKLTERINKEDLFVNTPMIVHRAISYILEE